MSESYEHLQGEPINTADLANHDKPNNDSTSPEFPAGAPKGNGSVFPTFKNK